MKSHAIDAVNGGVSPELADAMSQIGFGGVLALVLVFLALMLAIAPLFLQLSVWLVTKYKPKYGEAFLITIKVMLLSMVVGLVTGFVFGIVGALAGIHPIVVAVLNMLIGIGIYAWLYGIFVKLPDTGPVGFTKGLLITLVQWLVSIALFIGIAVIVAVFVMLAAN